MSPHEHDYPWVFHRDEVDILEDELEDLYQTFHQHVEDSSFESIILDEQLEMEERSDQELSGRLGFDVLEPPASVVSSRQHPIPTEDAFDSWYHDLHHVRSHPLYQKAKCWAAFVKPFVKRGYEQGDGYVGELFRVYANINLVPLKIFTALCEEMHEDELGWEIAVEEYRLALTYLERIGDSLSILGFASHGNEWVPTARASAETVREELIATISRLSGRPKRSL